MSGYIGTQPVPQATQTRDSFTCTAGQTSFATSGYTPSFLDVYLNGIHLVDGTDFTATNGSDVVLTAGAAVGDVLDVVAYTAFEAVNVTGADDFTVTGNFTSRGIDDNATSTAMTLDTSGNLLVGKTSDDINVAGHQFLSGNAAAFTRSGGVVSYMTRNSSDGEILRFRKDGSTVGSIGNAGTDLYIGTTDVGLIFQDADNAIYGLNTSTRTGSDAAIDLGKDNRRFKDLYLSGGVYLGGTGSANKLDDYEEGTWTPTITNNGFTNTPASITATYTKVGNIVHFEMSISFAVSTTVSALVYITGFPFVSAGSGASFARQACGVYNSDDPATGEGQDVGFIRAGQVSGQITFYKPSNPASDTEWLARGSVRVT